MEDNNSSGYLEDMENDTERTSTDLTPEEAMAVQGVLRSNGVPAMIVGPQILPNLEFQVQVPEHMLEEAQRLIDEAKAAGPQAAAEGELASERVSSLDRIGLRLLAWRSRLHLLTHTTIIALSDLLLVANLLY